MVNAMITNSYEHSCPAPEHLSVFCDCGATEGDLEMTAIARHVDACDVCRRTVEAYRQLDRLVVAVCRPPAGLEKRILAAVKASGQEPADRPWRLRAFRVVQAAAVVAVLALAAAVVMRYAHSGSTGADVTLAQQNQDAGTAVETTLAEKPVAGEAVAALPETRPSRLRAAGAVNGNDVQAVGIDRNGARPAAPAAQHYLPATVRHVWTTADLQQGRRLLDRLAQDGNGAIVWAESDSQAGSLTGKIQLADGKLQAFVDSLHGRGLQLVSPSLPQPGTGAKVKFTGQAVTYDLVLVRTGQ